MSDEARVTRLVGGNRTRYASEGGGLPLSDAFRAICSQLLAGPAPEALIVINVARVLNLQRERVAARWGTWEALTADLLAQLEYAGMVARENGQWTLGHRFRTATRMMPIPGNNMWFTVYTEEEQRQRNAAAQAKLDLTHAHKILEEAGMFTGQVAEALTTLDRLLTEVLPVSERTERRRRGRAVKHDIPKPPEEPGVTVTCANCEKPKAKTWENYEVYWHPRSGGSQWYWRVECNACRKVKSDQRIAARREKVRQAITDLHEQGEVTLEALMAAIRTNAHEAIHDWNYLARRSLVPVAPPVAVTRKVRAGL
jgi:hypothetical protein